MKNITVMQALNDIDSRWLDETEAVLNAPLKVQPKHRLWRSLAVAAVLILVLAPAAWAAYTNHLNARVPTESVHTRYFVEGETPAEGELPNVAMLLNVDVSGPIGRETVLRFGWLPEGAADPSTPYCGEVSSFRNLLENLNRYKPYPTWQERPYEELLNEAGMSEQEAETWFTAYHWETADRALLNITVFDASSLYQTDLLLGMYGGEARTVAEGMFGPYEMKEIQIDYRSFYQRIAEKNGHQTPEVEWFKNYLFLFEPEQEYLIFLGGSDAAFSFETLEKIADNLEVCVTGLTLDGSERYSSYLMLDLGRG